MFPLKDNIPTRRFPVLTVGLIAANVLMFFLFQKAGFSLGGSGIDQANVVEYGAIPYEIAHPGDQCGVATGGEIACEGQAGVAGSAPDQPPTWLTILTSMFMHGGLLHLGGNMLFLWIFGNNIEDSMGPHRFIAFYLLGGLAAVLAQTAIDPGSTVPTIGASGAVAAVLGGYALLYPQARVVTLVFIIVLFTVIELPALVVLGLWFLLQLLYGGAELAQPVGGGGGVAYFAHIGGFVFGLALIKLFADRPHEDYERPNRIPVY
ncbi:MAG TPA: rhomboid family intramembrane serine protease [Thermoleophilaceae bacterium]|nr:rhomboid family intramembrane serine protease [Thermoleophilaceae bacterium]